jgi:predicted metal-dependent hydrolase
MQSERLIDGRPVFIRYKRIKNLNLRLVRQPAHPEGAIMISAPMRMSEARIAEFVRSKADWITKQQTKLAARPAPAPVMYEEGAPFALWGEAYPLRLRHATRGQGVHFADGQWHMAVRQDAADEKKAKLMEAAYRDILVQEAETRLQEWSQTMRLDEQGLTPQGLAAQKMSSRWGSCHVSRRTIKLNSELARKPVAMLEYVLVHELVHLFERGHNARFYGLMDRYLPDWQDKRRALNTS